VIFDGARDWAKYVLGLVRQNDETAEMCLDGDEWTVETDSGPARTLMTIRIVSTKEVA
jgi:hypothetical protein